MPIFLATHEAEIRKIEVGSSGKKLPRPDLNE
jgi:hypothetical protein